MKRGATEQNFCLIQLSPFDVHSFFSVLATPLKLHDLVVTYLQDRFPISPMDEMLYFKLKSYGFNFSRPFDSWFCFSQYKM